MKKFLLSVTTVAMAFSANAGTLFSESLTSQASFETFTIENVSLAEGLNYVWSFGGSNYGAKATAFYQSANNPAESWLISPEIDLAGQTGISLSFDHALNFLNGNTATDFCQVYLGEAGSDKSGWTNISSLVSYPAGSNWTFVNSGDLSLDSFTGKKIQIGFLYKSTSEVATTWEIKNLQVIAGEADATPEFTVAEALAWLEAGNTGKAIVKGFISEIKEVDTGQYGNATYWIKDNLADEASLQVYRGYYLNGEKFTESNQIAVGDLVTVEGSLIDFNGTYEVGQSNKITSIIKSTVGITSILDNLNAPAVYYNLQGVKVSNPVKGQIYIVNGKKVIF